MDDHIKLDIKLPKVQDIELVALEGLQLMGSHLGIKEEKIGEARILVTEAIINGLEHSGGENPFVQVEFYMTKTQLTIVVLDYGSGFDPSQIKEPDISEKLSSNYKRGWGIKLMKSMSDAFSIESSENGTKITLIKNLV